MWTETGVLGLVQGLTEFLPVSSSAHLVFLQTILGIRESGLFLDVVAHAGTAIAVLLFFRADVSAIIRSFARGLGRLARRQSGLLLGVWSSEEGFRVAILICLASVPAAVAGTSLESFLRRLFSSPTVAAAMLLVTGVVLFLTRWLKPGERPLGSLGPWDAILVGLAQAVAIIPGISRSASTLSTLLGRGINREGSFRFAFLMSIPAVFGAFVLELGKLSGTSGARFGPSALGFVVAGVSGYGALVLLRKFVERGRLAVFAYYCWVVGALWLYVTTEAQFHVAYPDTGW